jgi:enoyl-CoA hydratase/carnithine racemase
MLAFYDLLSLMRLPIPTIAQAHGHTVGGGLALACDLLYAAEDARLDVNHARRGQAITYGTADLRSGLDALRERRAPRFLGR